MGEGQLVSPPFGVPPLTPVCIVPEVCGGPGMGEGLGEGLGEEVVLGLRLPVTSKAGPLASPLTDCLTLQALSAPF